MVDFYSFENWEKLKKYFLNYWTKGLITPTFFNYHSRILNEERENKIYYTNNISESLHRILNLAIKKGRCNINIFQKVIIEIIL